jgi:hypothetical protein
MPKLSILGVYLDTWRALWRLRWPLLQALVIPALALALIETGLPFAANKSQWHVVMALLVASMVLAGMFAVSCHRTVLLGPEHLGNRWGLSVGRPVLAYVGYLIGIGLLMLPIMLPQAILGGSTSTPHTPTATPDPDVMLLAAEVLTLAALTYVASRLCLVLPAVALRIPGGLAAAWDRSHRQGWRVTLAELLPGMTIFLITYPLQWLAERSGGFAALWLPVASLLGAVWVVALSCTFARLPLPDEDAESDADSTAARTDEAETGSVLG